MTLTFNPLASMAITRSHTQTNSQVNRSVGAKDRVESNEQIDNQAILRSTNWSGEVASDEETRSI